MTPDSSAYLAIERTLQGAFASHPKGMALPALCIVEVLDRASWPGLYPSPSNASGRIHVVALAGSWNGA